MIIPMLSRRFALAAIGLLAAICVCVCVKGVIYGYCGCEDLELQFYHGDKFLNKASFDREMVQLDIEYQYKGGILKDLAEEMERKMDKAIDQWESDQIQKLQSGKAKK